MIIKCLIIVLGNIFFKSKKAMTGTWSQDSKGRSLIINGEIAFF
jgi:hypothetical protein